MMSTLSQSEESSNDVREKEVANICFMAFDDLDEVNSNSNYDKFMIEYENCLKTSTILMRITPYLRRRFLSFKKNLMKSKKTFQKLKHKKFF